MRVLVAGETSLKDSPSAAAPPSRGTVFERRLPQSNGYVSRRDLRPDPAAASEERLFLRRRTVSYRVPVVARRGSRRDASQFVSWRGCVSRCGELGADRERGSIHTMPPYDQPTPSSSAPSSLRAGESQRYPVEDGWMVATRRSSLEQGVSWVEFHFVPSVLEDDE